MNICVINAGGQVEVSFTELETKEELEETLWEGERLVHFYKFDPELGACSNLDSYEAADVIMALTHLESTREVLEKLLTAVYRLSR